MSIRRVSFGKKEYIIPFVVIGIIFFWLASFAIRNIEDFYYGIRKDEAAKLARGYSQNISSLIEADDIINHLLEEKIRVALNTVSAYDDIKSNQALTELAKALEVDEVDYYDDRGVLLYSNIDEVIGWEVYEGHPIDNFLNSGEILYVEDIRQDVVTGDYFKYGYLRLEEDDFIQVGVRAERIHQFLQKFEISYVLEEMAQDDDILAITFINSNNTITSSTHQNLINHDIHDESLIQRLDNRSEFLIETEFYDEEAYIIFIPVRFDDEIIGTLAVSYSLFDTSNFIALFSNIAIGALMVIYLVVGYAIYNTSKNSKRFYILAFYDKLTGLPNIENLKTTLSKEFVDNKDKRAMLLVNVMGFKLINLTFGYDHGDKVLIEIAHKLSKLRTNNLEIYRLDGDRFIILVKKYTKRVDLAEISKRVKEILSKPVIVNNTQHYINEQIGIIELNKKEKSMDEIIKDLSISLDFIKVNNENYIFYNDQMEQQFRRAEIIEKELRNVLAGTSNALSVFYQPIVDLKNEKIVKLEALARLFCEEIGQVSPLEFIEIAEMKQLIVPLGNEIIRRASLFAKELIEQGYDIRVSINISGIQILRDDFIETIMSITDDVALKYKNIELEITETVLLEGYDLINKKLKNLKDNGFTIALDDFGTGYSSFYRLRELNVDVLKIDKYFIDQILVRDEDDLITGDIISMAHKFGIKVIAEGVEEERQKDYLANRKCDFIQGYLVSKPKEKSCILKLIKEIQK